MKAVQNQAPTIYWARVRNGMLVVWDGKQEIEFRRLTGKIVGVVYKEDEYAHRTYELALLHVLYQDERWIFSMRVDSQYFRTLCNYLHTCKDEGIHMDELIFCPSYSEKDGKKWTAIYIQQKNERWVRSWKHELPYLPSVSESNGKKIYDWTVVNNYYKNWLLNEYGTGWQSIHNIVPDSVEPPPDDPDDLPF